MSTALKRTARHCRLCYWIASTVGTPNFYLCVMGHSVGYNLSTVQYQLAAPLWYRNTQNCHNNQVSTNQQKQTNNKASSVIFLMFDFLMMVWYFLMWKALQCACNAVQPEWLCQEFNISLGQPEWDRGVIWMVLNYPYF